MYLFVYLFVCDLIICMAGLGASFDSVPRLVRIYEGTRNTHRKIIIWILTTAEPPSSCPYIPVPAVELFLRSRYKV